MQSEVTKRRCVRAAAALVLACAFVCFSSDFSAHAQSQWFGLQKPGTPADQQPLLLKKISIQQRLNTQIPLNLEFRDETGKVVHLGDYFGKRPVVLSLVYYQCKILCPEEIDGLVGALEMLKFNPGRDFDVVLVSIDDGDAGDCGAGEGVLHEALWAAADGERLAFSYWAGAGDPDSGQRGGIWICADAGA
jgi:protein SCO1/2